MSHKRLFSLIVAAIVAVLLIAALFAELATVPATSNFAVSHVAIITTGRVGDAPVSSTPSTQELLRCGVMVVFLWRIPRRRSWITQLYHILGWRRYVVVSNVVRP